MRHIPTTAARVEQLKKQAKRLKATKGGKHAELLNAVAKGAGYDHWHHVTQCLEWSGQSSSRRALAMEVESVVRAETKGEVVFIMTGPEILRKGPLVLFSTGVGDAWLVDPEDNRAACLVWQGEKRSHPFKDLGQAISIDWDGALELTGPYVSLLCPEVPEIGSRTVAGYPVEPLREMLLKAQGVERRFADVFGQVDGIELTDEVIADLVRQGWQEDALNQGRAEGARYSPGRDSLLYPLMSSDDLEDDE